MEQLSLGFQMLKALFDTVTLEADVSLQLYFFSCKAKKCLNKKQMNQIS